MLDQDPLAGQGEQGTPHFVLFLYLSPFPQDSWFLEAPLECPTWPILPHQCRQREMPLLEWAQIWERSTPCPMNSAPRFDGQDSVLLTSAWAERDPGHE